MVPMKIDLVIINVVLHCLHLSSGRILHPANRLDDTTNNPEKIQDIALTSEKEMSLLNSLKKFILKNLQGNH